MTETKQKSSGRALVVLAIVLLLASLGVWWARRRGLTFDVHEFLRQMQGVAWWHIVAGILLIYGSYVVRGYRWSVFMRRQREVGPLFLLGPQFTGFTAVAIFGRIADLSRPYLIARKSQTSLPSQIAVYTLERMFDLGAAALIFSTALAFTPSTMPHHEIFVRVGVVSLAGTLFLAGFAVAIRVAGVGLASALGQLGSRISPKLGTGLKEKVLTFRDGLEGIGSFGVAAWAGALSVFQWLLIALSYVQTVHAFAAEPTLAGLSFASTMLLMGASMGSSLLQLPVLGWFTQIGATAASMHGFYGTPLATATACGALLLIVNILCVIPAGLIYARLDGVSLTDLKTRSESAEEALA
ncbi:lysylphosphatidylglycerol synthase transmembrane domain-containing protein [Terriglobus aquaticus]|uniref:Lysylphosphatidylglycerol synthase transmembrane domain-containing protein n=1 Tax=Terriglobus aquaticus TaxID=940139 RepID=A0ABW9KLY4_9BACT|nr:lysylphosphatidylglycerol synthase transmembrane domain-containing protein [Terriglobus aquaticus]